MRRFVAGVGATRQICPPCVRTVSFAPAGDSAQRVILDSTGLRQSTTWKPLVGCINPLCRTRIRDRVVCEGRSGDVAKLAGLQKPVDQLD